MARGKKYLLLFVVVLGLFMLAAVAGAGPANLPDQAASRAVEATAGHDHTGPDGADDGQPPQVDQDGDVVNHGHCVSWAAHQANDDGVEGKDRGMLIAAVAQDEDAVSAKVENGSDPDTACLDAYETAKSANEPSTAGSANANAGGEQGRSAEARSNVERNKGRND